MRLLGSSKIISVVILNSVTFSDGSTVTWDTLDLNEVTLTATVYGRPEGHGEDLEIRVRKCEDAFQYYLKPPSIRLAAYCFGKYLSFKVSLFAIYYRTLKDGSIVVVSFLVNHWLLVYV